ncbi:MAG: Nramp family divalent metal transporter [Pirellulaceae bacterium]|nr:Nramp family divalent metal transporter [Pirellulaceae bacterium]
MNTTGSPPRKLPSVLAIVGPGMIVAATGVGAGDLATGAFTGSKLGVAILWAVVLGAVLKFTVNEGLARWQLATGTPLLEGVARHFGRWAMVLFLAYLVFWSYFVASALMSACGVAASALVPAFADPARGKIVFGIAQSGLTVLLIHLGGFRWFERIMSGLVGVMFVIVVGTAIAIGPNWPKVLTGLFVPRIPDLDGEGLSWTLALMGGIGGTVTVLSYGYWIRDGGRSGLAELRICRWDLASGYAMTALFGLGMVIIGSQLLDLQGDPAKGTRFIIDLGRQIEQRLPSLGPVARWGFIVGAWAAVYSSMLGVWQSVPFLFADAWRLLWHGDGTADKVATRSPPYLAFQLALATIPAIGLWFNFVEMQKIYAIVGALFIPVLAITLLVLNSRHELPTEGRNTWRSKIVLVFALVLFAAAGVYEGIGQFGDDRPPPTPMPAPATPPTNAIRPAAPPR